jgi:hypothetical protein
MGDIAGFLVGQGGSRKGEPGNCKQQRRTRSAQLPMLHVPGGSHLPTLSNASGIISDIGPVRQWRSYCVMISASGWKA